MGHYWGCFDKVGRWAVGRALLPVGFFFLVSDQLIIYFSFLRIFTGFWVPESSFAVFEGCVDDEQ